MKQLHMVFIGALLALTQLAWATSSPVPMLEQTADNIIQNLQENQKSLKNNPGFIQKTVEHYLLPNVDVIGMSRSVLGRQAWKQATVAQKKAFMREFTNLVIRTYSGPLAEYTDEKIKFYPVRGAVDSRFIRVNSVIIRSSGKNIPLTYSLVSKQGKWKIYDLSVEGVSLLQSFRSQFGQVLQNASMDELIQQMKQHKVA